MEPRVILITGASSGIGYLAAEMLAQQGHRVYGAARRVEKIAQLKDAGVVALHLDVTDQKSAEEAVKTVIDKEGRIDVLVNNAGYGSYGPIECVPLEEAQHQLDVNLLGLARMAQLVLPHMREKGSGTIVNVGSVAGRSTTYMGGWYHASKYAVEALNDALRMDVAKYGIKVALIEPGCIQSEWGLITADNLEKTSKGTVYEEDAEKVAKLYRKVYMEGKIITKPEVAAKVVVKAATAKNPCTRYTFGFAAKPLVFLHAILPAKAFDKLITFVVAHGWVK